MRKSKVDLLFDTFNILLVFFVMVITLYPFLHILAISLNDPVDTTVGGITIFPRVLTFSSYQTVFNYPNLYQSMLVSVARTVIGTALTLLVTGLASYALSTPDLWGFKFLNKIFIISMFISAGIVPMFLLYQQINIYNTFLVYILPPAFSAYYMILLRSYITQLPKELIEAAHLDGANDWKIFFKVIIPLSKPIIATIGLFAMVEQWNAWQDTLYYTLDPELETLQYVLMEVLKQAEASAMAKDMKSFMLARLMQPNITPESIKMAITIVATVPILCVYPFLQKYFVKGLMIGAVKG